MGGGGVIVAELINFTWCVLGYYDTSFLHAPPPLNTTLHHNAQIQSQGGLSIYFEAGNASCSFWTIPLYLLAQVSCVTLYYKIVLDEETCVVKFLSLWL